MQPIGDAWPNKENAERLITCNISSSTFRWTESNQQSGVSLGELMHHQEYRGWLTSDDAKEFLNISRILKNDLFHVKMFHLVPSTSSLNQTKLYS